MSTRRRLLYSLIVIVTILGGCELALRALGVMDQERLLSPLIFQQGPATAEPLPVEAGWIRWEDTTRHRPRLRGLRIATVGGSATQGDQVTPFGDFSHQLQRLLLRARPPQPIEVLNLGRGGAGSRQVIHFMERGLVSFHPDLVVVYSGNNEFHELRALKHSSPAYRANMERMRRSLHALRLYRLLQHLLGRDRLEMVATAETQPPRVHDIPTVMDAGDRALARQLYRENLERMVALGAASGVPVLLATVADNRADWSDQPPQTGLSPQEQRRLAQVEALRLRRDRAGLEDLGDEIFDELVDERAFFRTGRALLELGATDRARRYLDQAELVAARPNRSSRELRAVVREVAQASGAPLCDIAALLDQDAPRGVAGDELFADACHPNAAGHARIAAHLARCIEEAGLLAAAGPEAAWERPLERDPLRLDHDARRTGAPLAQDDGVDPAVLSAAQAGHLAFEAGRYDEAWDHYGRALEAGGPPAALLTSRAMVRWHQGRMGSTAELLEQARAEAPDDGEVANWLALLRSGDDAIFGP